MRRLTKVTLHPVLRCGCKTDPSHMTPLPDSTTVTDFTMHHRSSRRERFL